MKINIYLDMDGVVANFDEKVCEYQHLDEQPWLALPQFFRELNPIGNPNKAIEELQKWNCNVYLLSKVEVRDTLNRVMDKIVWAQEFLPSIPLENIIIVPYHESKLKYLKTRIQNSWLVDDYSKNLIEWENAGGTAIKFRLTAPKNHYRFLQISEIGELLEKLPD